MATKRANEQMAPRIISSSSQSVVEAVVLQTDKEHLFSTLRVLISKHGAWPKTQNVLSVSKPDDDNMQN